MILKLQRVVSSILKASSHPCSDFIQAYEEPPINWLVRYIQLHVSLYLLNMLLIDTTFHDNLLLNNFKWHACAYVLTITQYINNILHSAKHIYVQYLYISSNVTNLGENFHPPFPVVSVHR